MSTIIATTLSNGSVSVPTATVVNGSAKAWVNFNGTGTIAARDSFNVASLTDNGTGNYTVSFTNGLTNVFYVTLADGGGNLAKGSQPTNASSFVVISFFVSSTAGGTTPNDSADLKTVADGNLA